MKKSKLRIAVIIAVIITMLIPFFDINHSKASETSPGETESNLAWAVTANGFDKYSKWLEENNYNDEIRIAVIATGINANHEVFDGRLLYMEDINSSARNNYVGFGLEATGSQDSGDLTDNTGLGTAVAGLIAKSTPSNVKIIPVKAVEADDGFTIENGFDIYMAIADITKYADVDAIYCPFSLEYSAFDEVGGRVFVDMNIRSFITEKMAESSKNLICLCTAGEQGDAEVFAKDMDEFFCASALAEDGNITATSGRGATIDFALPSENLKVPSHTGINTYTIRSGANLAGALLTSAVGLTKTEHPDYTYRQVFEFLKENAKDIGEEGKDNLYGYGEINFNYSMFHDCDIELTNRSNHKAIVKMDDETVTNQYITSVSTRDTEKSFVVTYDKACIAAVSYDGGETYQLLKATATDEDNTYSYTFSLTSGNDIKIAVAIKGDVNYNGSVNGLDVKAIRKVAKSGDDDLSSLEKVFYNVNGTGAINGLDVKALRKEAKSPNSLTW